MSNSVPAGACCGPDSNARNVIRDEVVEQGRWIELDGMKTYITGPSHSKRAILFMYDILGLIPQSTRGCDLLASSVEGRFFVIMPDWFEGRPAQNEWLPPKTEKHKSLIQHFFDTTADVPKTMSRLQQVFPDIRKACPSAEKWAIVGFCWGGKIAALASQEGTPFSVSVQSSPAWLDYKDAEKIVIPTGLMASNGEPREEVDKFDAALKVENYVQYFNELEHGWMTSRAILDEESSRAEFEEGYRKMARFISRHM